MYVIHQVQLSRLLLWLRPLPQPVRPNRVGLLGNVLQPLVHRLGLVVKLGGESRQRKQVVGEAVDVLQDLGLDLIGLDQWGDLALGTAADRAGNVQGGGGVAA